MAPQKCVYHHRKKFDHAKRTFNAFKYVYKGTISFMPTAAAKNANDYRSKKATVWIAGAQYHHRKKFDHSKRSLNTTFTGIMEKEFSFDSPQCDRHICLIHVHGPKRGIQKWSFQYLVVQKERQTQKAIMTCMERRHSTTDK
ncbi:hypothetical protein B9Z55_022899 [Caenorhabditis nigoni]|uniref:Uncharacterized protein n=1 Tax=Caenorhabditis nigoni TaxID=1611254 RepID=A0A2G5SMG9_9PELO|nr:hypothetical protein B9Z55_022899 [Caenorhabditis nigoni]